MIGAACRLTGVLNWVFSKAAAMFGKYIFRKSMLDKAIAAVGNSGALSKLGALSEYVVLPKTVRLGKSIRKTPMVKAAVRMATSGAKAARSSSRRYVKRGLKQARVALSR
jgi:hypothetical protein